MRRLVVRRLRFAHRSANWITVTRSCCPFISENSCNTTRKTALVLHGDSVKISVSTVAATTAILSSSRVQFLINSQIVHIAPYRSGDRATRNAVTKQQLQNFSMTNNIWGPSSKPLVRSIDALMGFHRSYKLEDCLSQQ